MPHGGYDSDVSLLMHLDGADNGTTFTDETGTHSFSANSGAITDQDQKVFGTASLECVDGTDDYIYCNDHADFQMGASGTGDFTIDFRIRFDNLPAAGQLDGICGQYQDASNRWRVGYDKDAATLGIFNNPTPNTQWSWSPSEDTWYHVAIVRAGGTHAAYIDGVALTPSGTQTGTYGDVTGNFNIGWDGENSKSDGWIDEFRISTVARWSANFTPRDQAYSAGSYGVGGINVGSNPAMYRWKRKSMIYIPSHLHYKYREII